jgi:hypothetical protein
VPSFCVTRTALTRTVATPLGTSQQRPCNRAASFRNAHISRIDLILVHVVTVLGQKCSAGCVGDNRFFSSAPRRQRHHCTTLIRRHSYAAPAPSHCARGGCAAHVLTCTSRLRSLHWTPRPGAVVVLSPACLYPACRPDEQPTTSSLLSFASIAFHGALLHRPLCRPRICIVRRRLSTTRKRIAGASPLFHSNTDTRAHPAAPFLQPAVLLRFPVKRRSYFTHRSAF